MIAGPSSDYHGREQTQIKHFGLQSYLQGAARIIGTYSSFRFVDCCAGPWESRSPDYSDTSFGIACKVLKEAHIDLEKRGRPPRFSALLIEKGVDAYKKLGDYAAASSSASVEVRAERWDFTEHIPEIVAYCKQRRSFPFIFIDPKGWKLAGISTLKPLLAIEPCEVLINLMSSFIKRFINDPNCNLSDLLGADAPEIRKLETDEQEDAIVRKYCDMVKDAGRFSYVCALPVMGENDAFSFYLIYATRHKKGVKVFKDVERRTEEMTRDVRANAQQRKRNVKSANLELFDAPVLYKEKRYQELSLRNQLRAKDLVLQMIQNRQQLTYDDCWAEALQFPAVYEKHVREWLAEWEAAQLVSIEGRKKRSEVLKIDSGHMIVFNRQN